MSPEIFNNIRIILVNPTHPGNIGAAARAMKTMGLEQLYLVAPLRFPDAQATWRAAHAVDVLEKARVVDTLEQALEGCQLAFATSIRERALTWPTQDARGAAGFAIREADNSQIAFVFGREHSGLTNEELELCQCQVQIPSNPEYSSLNLAAAVQVICYELRMAVAPGIPAEDQKQWEWSTQDQVERFYVHLEQVLLAVGFMKPGISGQIISRLRRLFSRTRIEKRELNILRGILKTIARNVTAKPEL